MLAAHLLQLVAQLDNNAEHVAQCEAAIKKLFTGLCDSEDASSSSSDAAIVSSIPGVGSVVAATLLGEAAAAIAARDISRMRAITGCAPVSVLSRKRQNRYHPRSGPNVKMRYARSGRLADAVYHMARIASIFSDPHKERYKAMRARGHTHGRACRQLGDQMLTTLFAMLRTRTLYDASKITRIAA